MESNSNPNSDSYHEKKPFPWVALGIGGAALFFLLGQNKVATPPLSQSDIALLQVDPTVLQTQINNDTSPVIFQVSGQQMSASERIVALQAVDNFFSAKLDVLSSRLMVDKDILTNAITACLAIKDGTVRKDSLELFFSMFEAWSKLFCEVILSVGSGIASVTAATTIAITNAKTCATWTLVKKTTQQVDQTNTVTNSVSYSNSSAKIVFGLLGSKSNASSFHQSINASTMSENLVTEFIPFCSSQVVDPDAVFAIMSAHVLSLQPLYDVVQLAADLAPKIEVFVTHTNP